MTPFLWTLVVFFAWLCAGVGVLLLLRSAWSCELCGRLAFEASVHSPRSKYRFCLDCTDTWGADGIANIIEVWEAGDDEWRQWQGSGSTDTNHRPPNGT